MKSESTVTKPSIVFCHGLWADGSCFSKLIVPLQAKGYECIAAQYGLNTTAEDVALVRATIGRVSSPVILVGHSYGGSVITGAGTDGSLPMPMKRLRRSRPTSRRPGSSPTSKSWMDVSGCVRRAPSISAETFRSRSRSSFGRPSASPNPTCSKRKSGEPLGSRSQAGTSSAKMIAPCIQIWSASSPSAWAPPSMSSKAATCRCSPNRNA